MLSVEAELSLIQLLLFSPQLLLVFQISSSLFSLLFLFKNSPVVPSTVVLWPFLLLQSVVFLPHPQVFSNFFCCFTKILLFTFHNNIVLPYWGGRRGGTNTAIPHMVAREYRNTVSQFTQIPKPQLPMGKSWRCQSYKFSFQIEIILLCQCFKIKVLRCQAYMYNKHKIMALV